MARDTVLARTCRSGKGPMVRVGPTLGEFQIDSGQFWTNWAEHGPTSIDFGVVLSKCCEITAQVGADFAEGGPIMFDANAVLTMWVECGPSSIDVGAKSDNFGPRCAQLGPTLAECWAEPCRFWPILDDLRRARPTFDRFRRRVLQVCPNFGPSSPPAWQSMAHFDRFRLNFGRCGSNAAQIRSMSVQHLPTGSVWTKLGPIVASCWAESDRFWLMLTMWVEGPHSIDVGSKLANFWPCALDRPIDRPTARPTGRRPTRPARPVPSQS